jgi:hypothetical protein
MRDLERYVKMLAKRVASLEHQNAELRKRLATDTLWRPTELRSDGNKIEHLGSATAAAGVGSVLLRRGGTGGATDDDVQPTAEDSATAGLKPTSGATGDHSEPREPRFGRRNMLRLGGATAAAGAGAVLLRPEAAGADAGSNAVLGIDNNSGSLATGLTSTAADTLHVTNTGLVGEALRVSTTNGQAGAHVIDDGGGGAIFAEANSQAPKHRRRSSVAACRVAASSARLPASVPVSVAWRPSTRARRSPAWFSILRRRTSTSSRTPR